MSRLLNKMREHASLLPVPKRGTDTFTLTPPEGEAYHSCRLTLYESDHDSGAQVNSQPARGAQGTQKISVNWWLNFGDKVVYQLEAFTAPVKATPSPDLTRQMTGFLPSQHGFRFANSFPHVPDITLNIPFGKIVLGDAANGLCGGMVFAALDYFIARRPISAVTAPPTGNTLFDYLVRRLLESFNLPFGIVNYITLMNPDYPDAETPLSEKGFAPHGRAWHTIRIEWPAIKKVLDSGQPCPLGLVRVKASDLSQLGNNHQVLATGYDVTDDLLTLFIYDPNLPKRDNLTLTINLAHPEQPTPIQYSAFDGLPVFAFFRVKYRFISPPLS